MSIKKNIKTKLHLALNCVLSLVIVFNLAFTNVHEFLEHNVNSIETCSTEDEQDACHRYIFHHEESSGCDGSHQHINNTHKDCFVCKYFKERQHDSFFNASFSIYQPDLISNQKIVTESKTLSNTLHFFYLRGPPVFV